MKFEGNRSKLREHFFSSCFFLFQFFWKKKLFWYFWGYNCSNVNFNWSRKNRINFFKLTFVEQQDRRNKNFLTAGNLLKCWKKNQISKEIEINTNRILLLSPFFLSFFSKNIRFLICLCNVDRGESNRRPDEFPRVGYYFNQNRGPFPREVKSERFVENIFISVSSRVTFLSENEQTDRCNRPIFRQKKWRPTDQSYPTLRTLCFNHLDRVFFLNFIRG